MKNSTTVQNARFLQVLREFMVPFSHLKLFVEGSMSFHPLIYCASKPFAVYTVSLGCNEWKTKRLDLGCCPNEFSAES